MAKTYEQQHIVSFSECDINGLMRPGAIIQVAQDISGQHSTALGCSNENLAKRNIFWLLARQRYIFNHYPAQGDMLHILTWPGKTRFTMYPRYCVFSDQNGERYGAASSIWFLVDRNEGKMLTPAVSGAMMPDTTDLIPPIPAPERIIIPDIGSIQTHRRVCYSDADFNLHMNNARYMEWVCDLVEPRRFLDEYIVDFTLSYSHEASLGSELILNLYEQGEQSWVLGKNTETGQDIFSAALTWTKKHNE